MHAPDWRSPNITSKFKCNSCEGRDLSPLLELGNHPIAHRFLENPKVEEYSHPLRLWYCTGCGLAQLVDPIPPEELYTEYNWLSSWKYNPHIPRLIELIDQAPGLQKDSAILEVGSNDGSFLEELRNQGYSNLLGMEPARDACAAAAERNVETLPTYFNEETAKKLVAVRGKFDLLISRQVLEHVTELQEFRKGISTVLKPGGYCLIEVPNFDFALDAPDYSHLWEEHVNYFTAQTLRNFYIDSGFRVTHQETAVFSGEILIALGVHEEMPPSKIANAFDDEQKKRVESYKTGYPVFRDTFVQYLENHRKKGGRIAIYGAGCRSSALVNVMGLAPFIECFFDDQLEKQGKYMPGARLLVRSGSELTDSDIDLCLLAVNAENEDAVIGNHCAYLARGGRFVSAHPPSQRLPEFWKNKEILCHL